MKPIQVSGRRKSAIARASISDGKGIIKVNNVPLEAIDPKMIQLKIQEPLILAGDKAKKFDINVHVAGGGPTGQADAVRLAIARALCEATKDEKLKQLLVSYDRQLLVADVRRREMRKPNTRGRARAKRQKSYR